MVEKITLMDLKIVALLHDVPWKIWVITTSFKDGKVGRVIAKMKGRSTEPAGVGVSVCSEVIDGPFQCDNAHECEAYAMIKKVWTSVLGKRNAAIEQAPGRIISLIEADRLAASMDRWIIGKKRDYENEGIIRRFEYANIFNPNVKFQLERFPKPEEICTYVKEIAALMTRLRKAGASEVMLYKTLFTVLEPMWYKHCPLCIPLADTRVPVHTVFDHVKAVATVTNWTAHCSEEGKCKPEGFLVKLDIAGIQEFISSARKVSDLWAGSWLVSALIWYTVKEVVSELGPDILLSPSPDFNPFYLASFVEELEAELGTKGGEVVEDIKKLLMEYYLWDGKGPRDPIIPGTVFIALPSMHIIKKICKEGSVKGGFCEIGSEDDIVKYFHKRFLESWRKITSTIEGDLKKFFEALSNLKDKEEIKENKQWGEIFNCILNTLGRQTGHEDSCGKYNVFKEYLMQALKHPPLWLRVIPVNVKDSYESLESLCQKNSLNENTIKAALLHWIFAVELPRRTKEQKWSAVKVNASFMLADEISSLAEESYAGEVPRLRYCTVCGSLPAVVRIPNDEELVNKIFQDSYPQFKFFVTPGENLCPYCLIKRFLRFSIDRVYKSLGMASRSEREIGLSTSELACGGGIAYFITRIAELIGSKWEPSKEESALYEVPLTLYNIMMAVAGKENMENLPEDLIGYLYNELRKLSVPLYEALISGRGDEVLKRVREILDLLHVEYSEDRLNNIWKEAISSCSRYYSIVRGDGDFYGGRVVRGCLGFPLSEYLKGTEATAHEEEIRKIFSIIKEERRKLDLGSPDLCKGGGEPTILVTPAYYTALSRAQMVSAIKDKELIINAGGYVVYAGGDDIAALAPVWISDGEGASLIPAEIVRQTRLNYWGRLTTVREGFFTIKSREGRPLGLYPSPIAYGRSYGVLIAHHKDPFKNAWELAGSLEELKDSIKHGYYKDERNAKDITVLSFGRVFIPAQKMMPEIAILPNNRSDLKSGDLCKALILARDLAKYAYPRGKERKISAGLISSIIAIEELSKQFLRYGKDPHILVKEECRKSGADLDQLPKIHEFSTYVAKLKEEMKLIEWEITKACKIFLSGKR